MARSACVNAVLGLALAAFASAGCSDVAAPVRTTAELQLHKIYDAAEWLRRVPVDLAVGWYARSKIEDFVAELALPEDVRQRVLARVHADDFVDELIPFLLFVKDLYVPDEGGAKGEDFDAYLRKAFAGSEIPGMEHSMFQWEPPAGDGEAGGGLPSLDPDLARELVHFYDALYLRGRSRASGVEDRLACEGRTVGAGLDEATVAASPAIRNLLVALRDGLGLEGDMGAAVQGVLDDEARLTAATAALIRFIDQTVCRNYRFFATRVFRARQLEAWLAAELDAPGGGALWEWLEHANTARRYGVVIVVDGLEGGLVRALARGQADDPFLQATAAELRAAGGAAPRARSLDVPGPQSNVFFAHVSRQGFAHPAYLRFLRGLEGSPQAFWLPVGISTTPTISVRNIPIAQTGAPVAGTGATGLPNFHFVERGYRKDGELRGRGWYFYGTDAVELTSLAAAAGMQTLFERLPHLGSMSCTAQYDDHAHFGVDAFLNLGLGERLRDFGDRLCMLELERRAEAERELRALRSRLLASREILAQTPPWWALWEQWGARQERALARERIGEIASREQRTLPELLVYYNPWPDHFAHFKGPFADEIVAPSGELNRLDYWLGRLHGAYVAAGVEGRAVFGLAGDHGLAPVFHLLNPAQEVFDALREGGSDFRVVKISSDEGEGPKLTNPFDPPPMKGIDVVVASTAGGNVMFDLFRDQADRFTEQPLARHLRAVRPLNAAPDAPAIDLLAEIEARLADSLDYLVVREEPCGPAGGTVRIAARRSGAHAEGIVRRVADRVHYAYQGADLLDTDRANPYLALTEVDLARQRALRERCLAAPPDAPERWCDEETWRELTSYTPRPDSVVQLAHLYDSDRAGTVNLFPRTGVAYNSKVPGRHAGESFHEKNAFVGVWGGLVRRPASPHPRSAINGSVPVTVHALLTGEREYPPEAGWGYRSFADAVAAPAEREALAAAGGPQTPGR